MMNNLQKTEKWKKDIKQIENSLISMLVSRKIFIDYNKMILGNVEIYNGEGIIFHNWIVDNYITSVTMAIRRQLDTDSDVVSLKRLITEIKVSPESLSRQSHISMYDSMPLGIGKSQGNQTFTKYAGKGSYFDSTIADSDLLQLEEVGKRIYLLANREFAHNSTRNKPTVTFNDVDECFNSLKAIAQKYILILTASHIELDPIMPYWQYIFTQKWVK